MQFFSLVMNISAEKLDKLLPLLVLILDEPGGGPLPEELHEPALHLEPDVAREIEEEGKEGEVQRHPLVVGVVHDVLKHLILNQNVII